MTKAKLLLVLIMAASTLLFFASLGSAFTIHHQARSTITQFKASNSLDEAASSKREAPAVKDPTNIRNVAFVGHSHSGKTALIEWMLFDDNVITKPPISGESSVLDSDPIEAARHSSVFSHFVRVPHRNNKYLIEIADTPWGDFPSPAYAALDGADSAVLVVSAADGVQAGTVNAYQHCHQAGIKTMLALSKMDRPFLQVDEILIEIEEKLQGANLVPLQVRLGDGEKFEGVVPLLLMDDDGQHKRNLVEGIDETFDAAWTAMEEAVAMSDDDLLVDYLENSKLETDQILRGLRSGVLHGKLLPLVYTSAERNLGVSELVDSIITTLPNPLELREQALKAACESDEGKCGMVAGVEAGFAARVLHTIVDSFGSLSVLRVISNSRNGDDNLFQSLPPEVVNLRTDEKVKMPSAAAAFGLCGKERLPLADGAHINPGDVIAVPKLPESILTNDILTIPSAVSDEESEISIEASTNVLTPLSRPIEEVPLMASATISMADAGGKKSRGKSLTAGDEKLINALSAMSREDLAMRVEHDSTSGKLLLRCMSGDHLKLVALRLNDRFNLDVELGRPPVQYRETLIKAVKNIEGRHKKQSGGSGQFGVCYISMEPIEEGAGVEFESKIKGGVISKTFIASVEKGVREQLQSGGPLAGYPVTDVRVTLTDGKMHSVDSKDIAFQSAGRIAVKNALASGKTRLLQPMEKVTFAIDESLQGDINTIVSRHDGYVTSTNPSTDTCELKVEAIVPTASIADVSDVLRAASAGEGQFTTELSHYQAVPDNLVDGIVESFSIKRQLAS